MCERRSYDEEHRCRDDDRQCQLRVHGQDLHVGYGSRPVSFRNFWFSWQMNSIISEPSATISCSTRTVNGRVYAFGSSIVTSICNWPKFTRRNRSVSVNASVNGSPFPSSHPSPGRSVNAPRKLLDVTTSVSPSHRP